MKTTPQQPLFSHCQVLYYTLSQKARHCTSVLSQSVFDEDKYMLSPF